MEIGNKELQELEQRMKKEKSRRMFERYQTIHLYVNGTDTKQIAFIVGRTEETIKSYIHAYQNHGLKGLHMKVSPGAPERLTKEQQVQLQQTIMGSIPHEVGFTAKHNWTLQLIGKYIKREFGVTYSLRGISKLMHRLGMSYTKPTYTLAAADEAKQKVFVEATFPDLKKDI